MRRLLPAFVQRRLLLSAARRALQAGRPQTALEILRDELLADDPRASSLRTLVLPLVPSPPPPPPPRSGPALPEPANPRGELRDLLAQMRAGKPALCFSEEERSAPALTGQPPQPSSAAAQPSAPRPRPARLRMSLDDAGSFLICAGGSATVGHSRAGEADVPILADLLPRHARFVLEPASFHGGATWRVESIASARAWVGDAPLTTAGLVLHSGARIRLAEHTSLVFDQPDRASLSATLDLEAGLEAAGAKRILLFAPGLEGRLSIGAKGSRHVSALLGGVELDLVHDGIRLRVHCASGLIPDEAQGSPPRTEFECPLGLLHPLHLRLCMPTASERPRWISFAPLEDA